MASNGKLPESTLARIPGSGPVGGGPRLREDAAAAYNAMHRESLVRYGISLAIVEESVGRAYRSLERQRIAKQVYGSNAAEPGTSNHGWGLAIDLMTRQQRWVIDQIGEKYGFAKKWSDAQWEWWHIKWRPGVWNGKSPFPVLRARSRGDAVARVQALLRKKGFKSVPAKGKPGHAFYGEATRNAVKRFQKKNGLSPDGVVGPTTWRLLRR